MSGCDLDMQRPSVGWDDHFLGDVAAWQCARQLLQNETAEPTICE